MMIKFEAYLLNVLLNIRIILCIISYNFKLKIIIMSSVSMSSLICHCRGDEFQGVGNHDNKNTSGWQQTNIISQLECFCYRSVKHTQCVKNARWFP